MVDALLNPKAFYRELIDCAMKVKQANAITIYQVHVALPSQMNLESFSDN
jgi:hypothetical protein